MAKKALVFLAEGFEEVEAITPVDYLRRAGIEVVTLSLGSSQEVNGSHGIAVKADVLFRDCTLKAAGWDAVLCPGGMPGAANIAARAEAGSFIREMAGEGKLIAAICAAPAVILAPLGLLAGKRYTCFPGMEKEVSSALNRAAQWTEDRVVRDGNILTGRAAGTAGEFAAAIIGALLSEREGRAIAEKVLLLDPQASRR
ncbi:MAG: DJ-1/PfpI family protein [Treponema sp.]|jgi:4-methyl-5(b-hydroxyethyl)-thiazole monophosphate biosynthesis|nr:DJ-1/PfpI family protein [Treponema sp.]